MNTHNTSRELLARIALPAPHRSKLSFCASNKVNKVSAWVDTLHATQISSTSVLLYKALPEIHQLKASPETRLAMLETLRPTTQSIIEGLTKEALQKNVASSAEVKKASIVALSLQKSMLDGYTRCIYDFCNTKKLSSTAASQLALAIHRCITGIGLLFLKRYQLYTQPPSGLWLRLHSIFQIAEYFDFLATPIIDPLLVKLEAINIQCAYVRVLMMSSAKLNQLSKNDVQTLYDIFEEWSASVKLSSHSSDDSFYAINLDSDQPPVYKNRLNSDKTGRIIDINFHRLVSNLSSQQRVENITGDPTAKTEAKPPTLAPTLISHLIDCWSSISQRKQERKSVQTAADICIGLVDCHQMIGGGLSFDEFNRMGGLSAAAPPMNIFPNDLGNKPSTVKNNNVTTYRVTIQNQSAGGYCLLWKGDKAIRFEGGEFVAIKNIGKRTWNLCVIRWIKQLNQGTQLGVQLLSQSPIAAGAAQEYDMGGYSDYMRVFLCSSKAPGKALSIITPIKPFNEDERLKLYDGDGVYSIRLNECFFSTSIVKQFNYTPTDSSGTASTGGQDNKQSRKTQRSFDSSWD